MQHWLASERRASLRRLAAGSRAAVIDRQSIYDDPFSTIITPEARPSHSRWLPHDVNAQSQSDSLIFKANSEQKSHKCHSLSLRYEVARLTPYALLSAISRLRSSLRISAYWHLTVWRLKLIIVVYCVNSTCWPSVTKFSWLPSSGGFMRPVKKTRWRKVRYIFQYWIFGHFGRKVVVY